MRTGAYSYLKYGWESSYGGGASSRDKVFCRGQRVTALGDKHNMQTIPELGYREIKGWVYKNFEGSVSVEGILSNPWWLKALMGTVNTTGSSAPYTHTFTKASTLPSMEVEVGFQGETSSFVPLLRGAVINSATISTSVGEVATLRLDMYYGNRSSGTYGSPTVDTFIPFTMQHCSLQIPSGTAIGEVQNLELTITNNVYRRYEVGDYLQKDAIPQQFDATGRMTVALKDSSMINWVRSSQASGKIIIQSATDNSITVNLTDLLFDEWSLPIEPNAPVILDLSFTARDVSSIVAVNNVSAVP